MPTIVAICPYCRAGGVRAPQSAIGASATCPKCGSSFTVMPSDQLPGWASQSPGTSGPAAHPAPTAAPTSETLPAAVMPDATEPSPVVPGEAKPKARPAPATDTEVEPPEAEPADPALVLGLVALILVGIAVVASQFPFGRFIAAGVAGLGLLGGLAALGGEGRAKLYGGLAMGLHFLILVVVLVLPSWLNLDPWRGPTVEEPKGPQAVEHGSGLSRPVTPGDWLDAGRSSWEYQGVRVTVRSAHIAPIELVGPKGVKRTTKESYLQLRLLVSNVGVERQLDLAGWATGQADALQFTDAAGKALKPATFEGGWAPELGKPLQRVMPGHSSEAHFVFVAPPPKTDSLRLQLSGAAFGMPSEEIRFRIGVGSLPRPVGP